ncbi:Dynamin family-domain-containing protein [Bipolaris maydis]|nr:Dynamin family-domain-containing protein [Bipolaris maydis]KAJ5056008.1 Dynamin family-domain-containing protein [Bipolaris maydis]KAJ6193760.1 Dynamin family-domain-containing protein [Bipolaris maydis]
MTTDPTQSGMKEDYGKERDISAALPTELHNDVERISIKHERLASPSLGSPLEDALMRETTLDEGNEQDLAHLDRNIRRIIELQDPAILEAGAARAMQILESFKHTFINCATSRPNVEVTPWTETIATLIPQAQRKRTVIGVVGNTGAGKSSVINAMLNEERLVPTNCMRACTAVVTEISWNNSDEASSKYRAEIEFISPEDWEKELSVLMQEFSSENGTLSHEVQDPNSDAGVAWAKFHAVYPSVRKDALHETTIPDLMLDNSVRSVLGTTKQIHMSHPGSFYIELQKYVDSKEKVSKKDKSKSRTKASSPKTEYWPLIKVVKIYTKSSALSTGAVIVDLPGVHDSNAARAAVAEGYMKQCTGLWIVAPINRAVDDKAAKTLLGDSFKRQLKYDGGFSSVTFICSKTDDISITEAIDSLELDGEIAELEQQSGSYDEQIEQIHRRIKELEESQQVYKLAMESLAEKIETWETLHERLQDGEPVYAPITPLKKRKNTSSDKRPLKRQELQQNFDGEVSDSDDEVSDSDGEVQFQGERLVLSELDVRNKLKELREAKRNARQESTKMQSAIDDLGPQIGTLQTEKGKIRAEMSRICIAGRNLYSKSAIRQDFAAGIREIDQENAAEADEDSFDPDEEMRDYEQVAKSLPVFCVSSRAYQKMCGRMQKDDNVHGFTSVEETEIPQLQIHCQKLTEAGRIQTSRTFLTGFLQLLITFRLWTSENSPDLKLTEKDKQQHLKFLERRMEELKTGFDDSVHNCVKQVKSEVRLQISDRFPELVNDAIEAAPATAGAWGQKDQGGLMWASYKAVVRRAGVFHSTAAGKRDFNSDLVEPIMKRLATGWERTFQRRLPETLNNHIDDLDKLLGKAHKAIEARVRSTGIGLANLSVLRTRLPNYKDGFKAYGVDLVNEMKEIQREANRDFTPCIVDMMRDAYNICAAQNGPGSFKRMKEHMISHVVDARHTMFRKAVQKVEEDLEAMSKTLQKRMEAKASEIFRNMNRDYTCALGNQPTRVLSNEEREMKSATRQILRGIDAQFEPIANGDLSSVYPKVPTNAQSKEPVHNSTEGHGGTDDSGQVSFEQADKETNNVPRVLREKSRSFNQAYVEDSMDDDE